MGLDAPRYVQVFVDALEAELSRLCSPFRREWNSSYRSSEYTLASRMGKMIHLSFATVRRDSSERTSRRLFNIARFVRCSNPTHRLNGKCTVDPWGKTKRRSSSATAVPRSDSRSGTELSSRTPLFRSNRSSLTQRGLFIFSFRFSCLILLLFQNCGAFGRDSRARRMFSMKRFANEEVADGTRGRCS